MLLTLSLWVGMPNTIWLYFPRRNTQLTIREVWQEHLFDLQSVPALLAVICFPAWWAGPHLACKLSRDAEFCVVHFLLQTTVKFFYLDSVDQKEWQCFCWGENMLKLVGLMKNSYWGSWNRRQCLGQMLMQNTAVTYAVCDDGRWPRGVARLEEWLCMFVVVLV